VVGLILGSAGARWIDRLLRESREKKKLVRKTTTKNRGNCEGITFYQQCRLEGLECEVARENTRLTQQWEMGAAFATQPVNSASGVAAAAGDVGGAAREDPWWVAEEK